MIGLKEEEEKKKVVRTQQKKKKKFANIFVQSLAKKGIYVKGFK